MPNMKNRCHGPTGDLHYKGRGITVCIEWRNSFLVFREWALSHGYADTLELDRIDSDGNYDPWNCRWTTRQHQCQNTRKRSNTGSQYKGVHWIRRKNCWQAVISFGGHQSHLGFFTQEMDAARAYDKAAREMFREFARPNFRKESQC